MAERSSAGGGKQNFKVVLLGEGRVGKTSLVLRYVNNVFSENQQTTIQASFLSKRLALGDTTVNLAIWDTAGQERFHALGPIYYRDADGALLVYDTTDRDSFAKVKMWVQELRKMVGPDIVLCIAGNKIDLAKDRAVDHEQAEEYAQSVGALHCLTSARNGKGIDDTFLSITKAMLAARAERAGRPSTRPSAGSARIQIVADDEPNEGGGSGAKSCSC